jgi:hypothetical protein
MAPSLFQTCTRKNLTVAQALRGHRWTRNLKHELTTMALTEAVALWEKLQEVVLRPGTPDTASWHWTADGVYSAASAYAAQFMGATRTSFETSIWASDAPMRCRIFAWLAVQDRCLTTDAVAKRGWPHNVNCCLCMAANETAHHLLGACPMTIQVWCRILPMDQLPPCFLPQ